MSYLNTLSQSNLARSQCVFLCWYTDLEDARYLCQRGTCGWLLSIPDIITWNSRGWTLIQGKAEEYQKQSHRWPQLPFRNICLLVSLSCTVTSAYLNKTSPSWANISALVGLKKISFWVSQFYWNIEASLDICNWWNKVISVASTVLSYVNDFHSKAG